MLNVVLLQPEIPPNTGNIARLCAANDLQLHLIQPLGFDLTDKYLLRAGMDYWKHTKITVHANWQAYSSASHGQGCRWLLSSKVNMPYWDAKYCYGDHLIFGSETRGLPKELLSEYRANCLTIPMYGTFTRSLNLATATGIVVYEAIRQVKSSFSRSSSG